MIKAEKICMKPNKEAKYNPKFIEQSNDLISFTTNTATGENYLLIHDGKTCSIIKPDKGIVTTTIYNIEEFKTEKDCLNRIKELKLKRSNHGSNQHV